MKLKNPINISKTEKSAAMKNIGNIKGIQRTKRISGKLKIIARKAWKIKEQRWKIREK